MKKFIVEQVFESESEVLDLVSEDNKRERYMANPDDFKAGDEVYEHEFVIKEVNYVDEQGVGTGMMAFRC